MPTARGKVYITSIFQKNGMLSITRPHLSLECQIRAHLNMKDMRSRRAIQFDPRLDEARSAVLLLQAFQGHVSAYRRFLEETDSIIVKRELPGEAAPSIFPRRRARGRCGAPATAAPAATPRRRRPRSRNSRPLRDATTRLAVDAARAVFSCHKPTPSTIMSGNRSAAQARGVMSDDAGSADGTSSRSARFSPSVSSCRLWA